MFKRFKKEKGFTLVELLAVIVVLAIIALIGYSVIGNVISGTQESADKENVREYAKSVQLGIVNAQAKGETVSNLLGDTWLNQYAKKTGNEVDCASVVNDRGNVILSGCKVKGGDDTNNYCYDGNDVTICGEPSQVLKPNLLNDSLTPVVYDETQSSWVVADTSTEWYDYSEQKWANAVILNKGINKKVGDKINVSSEVKAMYVWIPRYEYKIDGVFGKGGTSILSPGEIEVNFIPKSQTEASSSDYILHPAFTWDLNDNDAIEENEHLTGIWVGKFETTGYSASPSILPNQSSLVLQKLSQQFSTARNFANYLTNNTNTDSHMMKNSEWGAVAYLSQSRFGKYGNEMYTGANKEVYQNMASNYHTGNSNGTPGGGTKIATQCVYDDIIDRGNGTGACGGGASTTGNIYGVYDMSGGTAEHVMGYLETAQTSGVWGSSTSTTIPNGADFSREPEGRYYDAYTSEDVTTACNGGICYGHGLSETEDWYDDSNGFITTRVPWITRGRGNTNYPSVGLFAYTYSSGVGDNLTSFRTVLIKYDA